MAGRASVCRRGRGVGAHRRHDRLSRQSAYAIVAWPVGYFVFFLPVGLATAWPSKLVPFVGLFAGVIALFVAVGDPLVFALSRFKPTPVPVERPRFFQFQIIAFVVSPFDR